MWRSQRASCDMWTSQESLLGAVPFAVRALRPQLHASASMGFLASEARTSLAAQLLVHRIRAQGSLHHCFVGMFAMFADLDVMIADLGAPGGLLLHMDIIAGAILLSPFKALVLTSASKAAWEVQLTGAFARDPSINVQRLRWRQSCRGGRTFVKPLALDRDVRSARARASRAMAASGDVADPRAALLIQFGGPLGADPDALLSNIITAIGTQTGVQLSAGASHCALRPGHFAAVRDGGGRWTGAFRVQYSDHATAMRMALQLRTFSVAVGDVVGIFDVHSPYLQDFVTASPADGLSGFPIPAAGGAST